MVNKCKLTGSLDETMLLLLPSEKTWATFPTLFPRDIIIIQVGLHDDVIFYLTGSLMLYTVSLKC